MNLNDFITLPNGIKSNFQYKEFVKSDLATRKSIVNIPGPSEWRNIEQLVVNVLQPIRYKFGMINITSGFRCPALCIAMGSTPNSNHTRGEAADIEPAEPHVTLFEVFKWIHDNLEYRELIAEYFPNGWVHVAYRKSDNTKIVKLKDKSHNYDRKDLAYIEGIYGIA